MRAAYWLCSALAVIACYFCVGFIKTDNDELAILSGCVVALGFFGVYHFDELAHGAIDRVYRGLWAQRDHDNNKEA
jgi:hypothetical protein